ncbi:hypothetical protein BDW68DRAFT_167126 [Aspergillus falconensis]
MVTSDALSVRFGLRSTVYGLGLRFRLRFLLSYFRLIWLTIRDMQRLCGSSCLCLCLTCDFCLIQPRLSGTWPSSVCSFLSVFVFTFLCLLLHSRSGRAEVRISLL